MNNTVKKATIWSSIAEVLAKLITPISNMVLARLLTPDAFGVAATASMVFSFADMFTDAGFQKYLVQHEFDSSVEEEKATTVAFWTNMLISIVFFVIIALFNEKIAIIVGNPGKGLVLVVSCLSLPITSFSSIQMALYRRKFDFKTLFYVRIVGIIIPLIVTIPIAILTKSYWALILGTITGNLSNSIIMTIKSEWKPRVFYEIAILKKMLSFSVWTLIETVTIWLATYMDVFIVGSILNAYYLGIYKTSMNTVNQITAIVTAALVPVLFSALSRSQNDKEEFTNIFFAFQRNISLLVLPMGIGIFIYREFTTEILLGSQWGEAAEFIGLWSIVNSVKIIYSNICSEAYRALGKPKVSVWVQFSQLIVMIPALIYGAQIDFKTLYVMRSLISCELIIVNMVAIWITIKISPLKMIINTYPFWVASVIMGVCGGVLKRLYNNILWNIISIMVCVVCYFICIIIIPDTRKEYYNVLKKQIIKRG